MDTRTALLDSAERAARQRGFDAFSYADLSREVGIRKASIHHHFPVKADLAFGLIERYALRFSETLANIDRNHDRAADKLRDYVRVYRDALSEGSQLCLCVAFSAGRESLSDPVLTELNQFHEDSVAWLEQVFVLAQEDGSIRGLDSPKSEASAALALMEGAQLMARAAKRLTPFDQATQAFTARLS